MIGRRMLIASGLATMIVAGTSSSARPAPAAAGSRALRLIDAARAQIGVTIAYDGAYASLAYPGGDIDRARGVCSDVVIRAYRDGLGIDLQRAVHEDMTRAFAQYPRRWGLSRPDRNIDHRRVPNLETFWTRKGVRLALPTDGAGWQPGDIFTSLVGGKLPHTGIISERRSGSGEPMAIHNIGAGTQEESLALAGRLIGRFRWLV